MSYMNVSIDIHSNQLLDWLIDRRHCSRNYQNTLSSIKQDLTQALQLIDPETRKKLEKLTSLCYYHIQDLFESLQKTENVDTNIFGSYNSPVLKSLYNVLKSYEKGNLHLAESAMVLARLQVYEIPYYRKQISKLKNTQLDLDKKITDLNKRSEDAMARYYSNCKKYGVSGGENLIQELTDLTSGLGDFLNGVAEKCKELEGAIGLFNGFSAKHKWKNTGTGGKEAEEELKVMKYIVKWGNTSVHEFEYGRQQSSKGGSSGNGTSEYELVNNEDFPSSLTAGDTDKTVNNDGKISADASNAGDIPTTKTDLGDIDWGIDDVTGQNDVIVASQVANSDIDFGDDEPVDNSNIIDFAIEVVGDSENVEFANSNLIGSTECKKKTSSLFESQETRLKFLTNLEELKCFLLVRKLELEQSSDSSFIFVQTDESIEQVNKYLQIADEILQSLTNQKTRDLLIMLNDCSHIEKIAEGLLTKKKLSAQLKIKAESLKEALFEAAKEEQSLRPMKAKLEEDSNFIRKKIEESVSQLYKGRPVSIILTQ